MQLFLKELFTRLTVCSFFVIFVVSHFGCFPFWFRGLDFGYGCTSSWPFVTFKMSHVVRKSLFGVSELVRHKPGCAVTEDG